MTTKRLILMVAGLLVLGSCWPDPRADDLCFENFKATKTKWWSAEDYHTATIGPVLFCSQVIDGPAWRYQRVYALTSRFKGPFVVVHRTGGYEPWHP